MKRRHYRTRETLALVREILNNSIANFHETTYGMTHYAYVLSILEKFCHTMCHCQWRINSWVLGSMKICSRKARTHFTTKSQQSTTFTYINHSFRSSEKRAA